MSTDLIERLRSMRIWGYIKVWSICEEAADEIELLRKAAFERTRVEQKMDEEIALLREIRDLMKSAFG